MTAARVEAVAWQVSQMTAREPPHDWTPWADCPKWEHDSIVQNQLKYTRTRPLYDPAAVAALMRQMVPEAAVYNEMTRLWQWCAAPGVVASFRNAPAASAWNLCRERQLALIARWESEKGEGE